MTEERTTEARAAGAPASGETPGPERGRPPGRGRRQGALEIIRYNWPFYATAAVVAAGSEAVAAWAPVAVALKLSAAIAGGLTTYLAVASVVASYLVYDRSGLCEWDWIPGKLAGRPRAWSLLHAGLDLASAKLRTMFPGSDGRVLDFYDAKTMTEPSIRRARKGRPAAGPSLPAAPGALPIKSGGNDAVFLLFSAHEIREPAARLRFFTEVHRSLRPGGRVVLVEHLRDAANFLAFGPGFLHFLPRREWLRLAAMSGLDVVEESRRTPFVRVFILERPQ